MILGLSSCSKQQGAATPSEIVLGRWELIQYAFDDNNDGVIEDSEIHNQPSWHLQELTFGNNGTGNESDVAYGIAETPQSFNWFINGNDYMTVSYVSHDTVTYFLSSLNSSNLIMTTHSNSALLLWYNYSKK